jgi:hypothetical protein
LLKTLNTYFHHQQIICSNKRRILIIFLPYAKL